MSPPRWQPHSHFPRDGRQSVSHFDGAVPSIFLLHIFMGSPRPHGSKRASMDRRPTGGHKALGEMMTGSLMQESELGTSQRGGACPDLRTCSSVQASMLLDAAGTAGPEGSGTHKCWCEPDHADVQRMCRGGEGFPAHVRSHPFSCRSNACRSSLLLHSCSQCNKQLVHTDCAEVTTPFASVRCC